MLFDQIPQSALKRISAEVKVDLKLASLTLRKADNPVPTRSAKLKIVERFIDSHHHVGTIHEPGNEYFRGQMDMKWGWLQGLAVWFQGNDFEHGYCVALGGSRHHVLSGQANRDVDTSFEERTSLVSIITLIHEAAQGIKYEDPNSEYPHWAELICEDGLLGFADIPKQRLDFLAIPLAEEQVQSRMRLWESMRIPLTEEQLPEPNVHVVLGTPLYVALAR